VIVLERSLGTCARRRASAAARISSRKNSAGLGSALAQVAMRCASLRLQAPFPGKGGASSCRWLRTPRLYGERAGGCATAARLGRRLHRDRCARPGKTGFVARPDAFSAPLVAKSNGFRLRNLARDVRGDALDRVEVLGQHLAILHRDAEGRLDEADDFEHAGRVDDALVEQRCAVIEKRWIANVEVGGNEVADLLLEFHQFPRWLILLAVTTRTSPAALAV